MRRVVMALTVVGVLLVTVLGPAWAIVPKNGVYQGVVNGSIVSPTGHNEGEGYFRAKGTVATKKIVATGDFTCGGSLCSNAHILAPSDFMCNQLNANLEATKIPVTAGAFDYTGKANIGTAAARMNIRFKGAWATQSKVKGFTRIWNGSCDSGKIPWTMRTPPPA